MGAAVCEIRDRIGKWESGVGGGWLAGDGSEGGCRFAFVESLLLYIQHTAMRSDYLGFGGLRSGRTLRSSSLVRAGVD